MYNKFIIDKANWYDPHVKYDVLYFLKYLTSITCQQFQQEFGVNTDADIATLVKCLATSEQLLPSELGILAAVKRHLEYSDIGIRLEYRTEFHKMPDAFVDSIFFDVEHRLHGV